MVCLALLRGLRLVEVPVNYRGRIGESKITGSFETTLRVGGRMIALILRYLGMDPKAAMDRCMERRPGALYNGVFRDYLLSGLVHPEPPQSASPSANA